MAPLAIVEHLDVFEDRPDGLLSRGKAIAVNEFPLQRGKETPDDRVDAPMFVKRLFQRSSMIEQDPCAPAVIRRSLGQCTASGTGESRVSLVLVVFYGPHSLEFVDRLAFAQTQ